VIGYDDCSLCYAPLNHILFDEIIGMKEDDGEIMSSHLIYCNLIGQRLDPISEKAWKMFVKFNPEKGSYLLTGDSIWQENETGKIVIFEMNDDNGIVTVIYNKEIGSAVK
jgi:hypothetical protein